MERKRITFKSLAISNTVHLAITTKVPDTVIEELKQIKKKNVLRDNKKVKIKQNTLRNDCKDGALKSVDVEHAGLKSSWVKRLYTENSHE